MPSKVTKPYTPPQSILDKYADVLINYGLNEGIGVKKGEVVLLQVPVCAMPLARSLNRSVLRAGAHPIMQIIPDDTMRDFFTLANEAQITFFPDKLLKGRIDQCDHFVSIIAETDKHELDGIKPSKIMSRQKSMRPYIEWRDAKEVAGKFGWTLAMYGTPAMAKEVKLTEKQYWQEIIKACYLNEKDPVKKWKSIMKELKAIQAKLNALKIQSVHIEAPDTDLHVALGDDRGWIAGTGRNVPSFECFISPDWRGTNGKIKFTEPLYRFGSLITGVELEFKDGLVVNARAKQGEKLLKEMITQPNANKIGEFSLTDKRMSQITHFMGETLFDENVGGKYGNTHLALGRAYKDSFPGDQKAVTKEQWEKMGYNDSVEHTDIVATSNRTVTATLKGGKTLVIYKDGKFTI